MTSHFIFVFFKMEIERMILIFIHYGLNRLVSAQTVPDNENYVDDLSFLDIAMDRGENARLCVCISGNCVYYCEFRISCYG